MLPTDNAWLNALALIILLAFLFYKFATAKNNYWKDRNVAFAPPEFLFGNMFDFVRNKRNMGEIYKEIYDAHPEERYVGVFRLTHPQLMIKDPDLLRDVFIKNFNCYQNRLEDHNETKEKLTSNMFTATKEKWRTTRQKLSPTFTSGKLRNMFYLILEKSDEFERCLEAMVEKDGATEVRELMARFTTEVIASCAFGLKLNSMLDTEDTFRKMGKLIFEIDFVRVVKFLGRIFSRSLFYALGFTVLPRKLEDFFLNVVKDVVESRKGEPIKRNDFVDLLIDLKHQDGKVDFEMDDDFMAAQVFIFFAAGFETSSTAMSSILFELARHPQIQDELIEEIDTTLAKSGGKITYENIQDMEYLDMVTSEGMRKYPALTFIPRTCTMTNKLADGDLVVEKGLGIAIPVLGLHYDPKYYPDPEKFMPERFSLEGKKKLHPMVYLPFGEGPRNCIGMRFGKIQVKVGIVSLLKNYRVEPSPKTNKIVFEPKNFVSTPKGGIWLNLTKRTKQNQYN